MQHLRIKAATSYCASIYFVNSATFWTLLEKRTCLIYNSEKN